MYNLFPFFLKYILKVSETIYIGENIIYGEAPTTKGTTLYQHFVKLVIIIILTANKLLEVIIIIW